MQSTIQSCYFKSNFFQQIFPRPPSLIQIKFWGSFVLSAIAFDGAIDSVTVPIKNIWSSSFSEPLCTPLLPFGSHRNSTFKTECIWQDFWSKNWDMSLLCVLSTHIFWKYILTKCWVLRNWLNILWHFHKVRLVCTQYKMLNLSFYM